jgi:hypothetical protein
VLPNEYGDFTQTEMLRVGSSTVDNPTIVTFKTTSKNPIQIGAKITFTISKDMFVLSVATVTDLVFKRLNDQGIAGAALTVVGTEDATTIKFVMDEWCSGGVTICPAG